MQMPRVALRPFFIQHIDLICNYTMSDKLYLQRQAWSACRRPARLPGKPAPGDCANQVSQRNYL